MTTIAQFHIDCDMELDDVKRHMPDEPSDHQIEIAAIHISQKYIEQKKDVDRKKWEDLERQYFDDAHNYLQKQGEENASHTR